MEHGTRSRSGFRDMSGLLGAVQRVVTHQNEAWLRVLRKATAGGYTPGQWVSDMTDMAQQWYGEIQAFMPGRSGPVGSVPSLPIVQFELDADAEGADAKPMLLTTALERSPAIATPLRSLNDTPLPSGPRVTVKGGSGSSQLLIGLAALRKLGTGRYVSAIEDASGQVLGIVFVHRA
jgi:hypothetical protein